MRIWAYSTDKEMSSEYASQVTVGLLLLSLMGVLAIALLATFLAFIHVRRGKTDPSSTKPRSDPKPFQPRGHYRPSIFEQSCRWAVVKTTHIAAVQSALGLHNPMPCSWEDGLAGLTSHRLFVSPPVRGWILIVGPGLPDPSVDIDRCYHFVVRLSRALGQVQFFSLNRAVDHYCWVRAEGGRARRAYAWAGETLWNEGPLTPAEVELGVQCLDYCEKPTGSDVAADLALIPNIPNVEKVIPMAGRWSFDPTSLDENMLRVALGVTGEVATTQS
jgi:hypothetical protein